MFTKVLYLWQGRFTCHMTLCTITRANTPVRATPDRHHVTASRLRKASLTSALAGSKKWKATLTVLCEIRLGATDREDCSGLGPRRYGCTVCPCSYR